MVHIVNNLTYDINILIANYLCQSSFCGVKPHRPNLEIFLCSFRLAHWVSVNSEHADNHYVLESFHHVDLGTVADVSEVVRPNSRFNTNNEPL
jgi:hypothetical protein